MSDLKGTGNVVPDLGSDTEEVVADAVDMHAAYQRPKPGAYKVIPGGLEGFFDGSLYADNGDGTYTMVKMSKWD